MAWTLMTTPKVQRVTKRLANEFAEMTPAPSDRPLSTRRLDIYKKIIERKEMRPVTWAKAHCLETNDTYRCNGKHTSTLYNSLNLDGHELHVLVEEYKCDTLEDVAKLYATFDSKTASRTAGDINRSFAASVPELAEVTHGNVNLCVAGINYYLAPSAKGGSRVVGQSTPAERAEVLLDHTKFVVWVNDILHGDSNSKKHLRRLAVVAAMCGSYHKNQKAAEEFWCEVRDGTGARPDVPSRKLEKFLLTHVHAGSGNRVTVNARHKVRDKEIFVKSVHAWNAWRKKENTNLQYHHDKPIPAFV
jgi:hypothetical protein